MKMRGITFLVGIGVGGITYPYLQPLIDSTGLPIYPMAFAVGVVAFIWAISTCM